MSNVKIQGNASGTGTVTIAAPNTNTDRTLTLPDGAGEILTDASSLPAANLTGTLPAIDGSALTGVGGGKVVQFVYSSLTAVTTTTSTSYSDVKTISITPTANTSTIVAVFGFSVGISNNAYDANAAVRIYNSTQSTVVMETQWNEPNANGYAYGKQGSAFIGIDTPASTSSQTYAFQFVRNSAPAGGALAVNPYNDTQWCYLMEISA